MLPCVCSVIDHRWRKSVVGSGTQVGDECVTDIFRHILTSSVIYYWTDPRNMESICFIQWSKKYWERHTNLHRTAWLFYREICASLGIFKVPNATFRLSFFFSSISYLHTVSSKSFQRLQLPKVEKWPKHATKQRAS